MKTVVAKLDDETVRELDSLAVGSSRSDVIRDAIRRYIAAAKIELRRRQVEEFVRSSDERNRMRELAESDMDEAAELLACSEKSR